VFDDNRGVMLNDRDGVVAFLAAGQGSAGKKEAWGQDTCGNEQPGVF
jgi:hypothetical protein